MYKHKQNAYHKGNPQWTALINIDCQSPVSAYLLWGPTKCLPQMVITNELHSLAEILIDNSDL